jgi:dTDP-4-amino-4,6-dideoxygalactose transaminase
MRLEAAELAIPTRVPFLDITAMSREVAVELDVAWRAARESSTFIGGPSVERFETAWASYCGTAHAIGVANGTDALELTLRALGIGPGDEVVVPANTFIATAEAVVQAGATPRFADVDPGTLLATAATLQAAITPATAALVIVELFGNMPRMDEIVRLARRRGLALIEDAAQAHGAKWDGARAGSFGDAACFSFYPGKNLGAFGDAGAVVTDDTRLAESVRSMADHGRAADSKHVHPIVGRNSRLDALQAAVLTIKLGRLDAWNARRRVAMAAYRRRLDPALVGTVELEPRGESVHHLNVVRVPDRDRVRERLDRIGIDTGIHYPIPCHLQEGFLRYAEGPLPNAEEAAEEIVSLPMYPHLDEDRIRFVSDRLNDLVEEHDVPRR